MQATAIAGAEATALKPHVILVHGACHGGWCWYKVATLLRAAGHRVDAPDLVASGADARRPGDAPTFDAYARPLLDALRDLPPGERAVLVGHSFGGMSVALAAEEFPEKVAAAVFVAAFMPDCTRRRSYVMEQHHESAWMDTAIDPNHDPPSLLFGPEFLRKKLYHMSSPEDYKLGVSLVRKSSLYVADLQRQPPLSKRRYGSVRRVYVVVKQDMAIVEQHQRWMLANFPVADVREMATADHMAMLSAPEELAGHLADVADAYA